MHKPDKSLHQLGTVMHHQPLNRERAFNLSILTLHRQIPHYPARNEKHAAYCSIREYHVTCGPERHCDKSCDNMYSPPHCYHDPTNPKCYFPRCLCKDGYVRNSLGHCIWEHQCPNRYSEPNKNSTDIDGMVMEFVPFVRPRHRARKARHPHRHRRLQLEKSA
ncbi:hypothetical protein Y032_0012g1862 [Ancylostoma ceylanicum]|uniref:TIL domain-containing protein n=1 Tax=Ancylostoma ceylanicum TaxID=53326 RepID=A0A016VCK9_9BILA|nr:hypothetical protein Y032_0012g1862 [Ancylostoma ceylanicum]